MNSPSLITSILVTLFCTCIPLHAVTWVSSPAQLKTAASNAQPGDRIIIRNGTYRNAIWEIYGNGTSESPIEVRAETPGKVISTGSSAMRISGSHVEVEGFVFTEGYLPGASVVEFRQLNGQNPAQNCRLTQTAIINYSTPNRATRVHWVSLYGRNNRVDHCYFYNHNNNGVTMVVWLSNNDPAPVNHRIDNNHFDYRPEGGENGWETIRIGDSDTSLLNARVLVENNLFTQTDGEIETISNKSCENIFRNNVFFRTRGMLTLRHGNRCIVDGNWFLGDGRSGTGGIRVIGTDHLIINNYIERTAGRDGAAITLHSGVEGPNPPLNSYFAADRAIIAYNTIISVTSGAYLDLRTRYNQDYTVNSSDVRKISLLPEDVVVANNIFLSQSGGSGPFVNGLLTPGALFEGNIFHGSNPIGSNLPESAYRTENPGYSLLDGIYQPGTASTIAGTATGDYPDVTEDIFGRLRSQTIDPGAFQVSGSAEITRPDRPATHNSGPPWLNTERDLTSLLWPIHANFFTASANELTDDWLAVEWLGYAHVAHFPWVYVHELSTYLYFPHQPETGTYWLWDPVSGWCQTTDQIWPYFFSIESGWGVYTPNEDDLHHFL